MTDKPQANMTPIIYAHRIHELQAVCRVYGYALALHGSMQRDLDAIAVPWTETALSADLLIDRICEAMGLERSSKEPSQRAHGRLSWSLHFKNGLGGFVDMSVMPLSKTQPTCRKSVSTGGVMVISKVELEGYYSVIIENDPEKKKSQLGIDGWNLMFTSKRDVLDHIALLNKALEFWEYDQPAGQEKGE